MEWVALGVTVLVQGGIGLFVYGKLTERVGTHNNWIRSLDSDVKNHETRISHLEGSRISSRAH